MPDWFSKASQAVRGQPAESPQPYEVACGCGRMLTGLRQEEYSVARCPQCGDEVFVLPRNVYPSPDVPVSAGGRGQRARGAATTETAPLRKRLSEGTRDASRRGADAVRRVMGRDATWMRRAAARPKRWFTPFRLVLLSIAAVIAVTGYWAFQTQSREQAEVALRTAVEEGNASLAAGDLHSAGRFYASAAEALDVLNRDDAEARNIRQLSRETEAANNLVTQSLSEIAADAVSNRPAVRANWKGYFDSLHRGRWIVMETRVHRVLSADGQPKLILNHPLSAAGRTFTVDADLPLFRKLSLEDNSRRVVFAAQLESCMPDGTRSNAWTIRLSPETAFLWTHVETLRALGFPTGPDAGIQPVEPLLEQQAQMTGLEY